MSLRASHRCGNTLRRYVIASRRYVAIALFDGLKNQPRGNIVNRSTILREVETRVAALTETNADFDDLALQFDETEAGKQFIAAWKQAGTIVDAGHGHGDTPATPVTPTP